LVGQSAWDPVLILWGKPSFVFAKTTGGRRVWTAAAAAAAEDRMGLGGEDHFSLLDI